MKFLRDPEVCVYFHPHRAMGSGVSSVSLPCWVLPPHSASGGSKLGCRCPTWAWGGGTDPSIHLAVLQSQVGKRGQRGGAAGGHLPVTLARCLCITPHSHRGLGRGMEPPLSQSHGGFPARWAGNHAQHFEFLRKKRKFLKGVRTTERGFAMEMQSRVPWGCRLPGSRWAPPLSLLASPQQFSGPGPTGAGRSGTSPLPETGK